MGFGAKRQKKQNPGVGEDRLAAITGAAIAQPANDVSVQTAQTPAVTSRPVSLEPDLSRIRKSSIDETPAQRKQRLAAKTVNFSATIIARIVILGAVGFYAWQELQGIGAIHRGVVIGLFVMVADLGRVIIKAMDPGSK